jgi:hypothetical protein
MSDDAPKKPDEAEARRALVKVIEEFDAAHPDWREGIHITPEGKWGTPWPEGTKDDPPARWKLFGMRSASMLVQ